MHANQRKEVKEAVAGDIVAIAGPKLLGTGDTLNFLIDSPACYKSNLLANYSLLVSYFSLWI